MAFEKISNYGVVLPPQEFTCESADTKPLVMTDPLGAEIPIPKHSTCWVYDTKEGFIFDGTSWREV